MPGRPHVAFDNLAKDTSGIVRRKLLLRTAVLFHLAAKGGVAPDVADEEMGGLVTKASRSLTGEYEDDFHDPGGCRHRGIIPATPRELERLAKRQPFRVGILQALPDSGHSMGG